MIRKNPAAHPIRTSLDGGQYRLPSCEPAADYVNVHPSVLHLWRPLNQAVPFPPKRLV